MYKMKTTAGYRLIKPATSPTTRTLWLPIHDVRQIYPNIQLLMRFGEFPEPYYEAEYWDICPDRRFIIMTECFIRMTIKDYTKKLMMDEVFLSKLKEMHSHTRIIYDQNTIRINKT